VATKRDPKVTKTTHIQEKEKGKKTRQAKVTTTIGAVQYIPVVQQGQGDLAQKTNEPLGWPENVAAKPPTGDFSKEGGGEAFSWTKQGEVFSGKWKTLNNKEGAEGKGNLGTGEKKNKGGDPWNRGLKKRAVKVSEGKKKRRCVSTEVPGRT